MPFENWRALESKSVYGSRIVPGQVVPRTEPPNKSFQRTRFFATRATYDELYAACRQVYRSLRGLYHTLNRQKGQAGE